MKYPDDYINQIIYGDCLEIMPDIPHKSIDMILCDLPYGTTACKWDTIIPLEPLWKQYKRIIKDNGAIVLTASQPFTSKLIMSNLKMFKYEWIWHKPRASNFQCAKTQPLKEHENILVFSNGVKYFPQMMMGKPYNKGIFRKGFIAVRGIIKQYENKNVNGERYPRTIQYFVGAETENKNKTLHPTQKPVALFEYLIKTYTNKGDLVLDNCAGSGTTGVACINLKRNYILIEKEEEYCEIAKNRIKAIPELLF